jgi:hypothetical protein
MACRTGDMDVDGPRADRAAARQRDVRRSEPRDERTEHEDRRTHRLDELVRRKRSRASSSDRPSMRMRSSTVTLAPTRPSNSIIVVTSFRCGTLPIETGLSASSAAARDRQRGILGTRDAGPSPSSGTPPRICSLST